MTNAQVFSAVLIPFIAWRFYRRVRTNIGRQKFSAARSLSILVIFSLISLLIALSTKFEPRLLATEAGGLLLGAAVGLLGLKLTQFEDTDAGCNYTPNSYLGVGISLLFIGRILYRFITLATTSPASQPSVANFGQSPLTLGLFGLIAGYYISYHAGLLARQRGTRAPAPTGK